MCVVAMVRMIQQAMCAAAAEVVEGMILQIMSMVVTARMIQLDMLVVVTVQTTDQITNN
jgi:hypothetical protein